MTAFASFGPPARDLDRLVRVGGGIDELVGPRTSWCGVWTADSGACVHRRSVLFLKDDLWVVADTVRGTGAHTARLLYALERWGCRAADRVNVLTPAFRDDLLRRGLKPAEQIVCVPNGADLDLFSPGPRDNAVRREQGWGDRFVVPYVGAHGRANAMGQRGRAWVVANASRTALAARYLGILEELVWAAP